VDTRNLKREDIVAVLKEAAARMQENHVKKVRDLDAEIGDGDLGITVQKGFRAVEQYLSVSPGETIAEIIRNAGMEFSEANPSTFSAFLAAGFRKAATAVKEKNEIDTKSLADMFKASVQGIMKLGRAQAGDKTLLDALIPSSDAVNAAAGKGASIVEALHDAADEAETGMTHTVDMMAKQGRARSFGDRTRGVQDPGATVVAIFLREIVIALDAHTGNGK